MNKKIKITNEIEISMRNKNFEVIDFKKNKVIMSKKTIINSISEKEYSFKHDSIIILVGIGLGLIANKLIENENIKMVYIYEPQEIYQRIFEIYDSDHLLKNEKINYFKGDLESAKKSLFNFFMEKSYNIEILYSDYYLDCYPNLLLESIKKVKNIILEIKMNFVTFLSSSEKWQLNLIKNYESIYNSVNLEKQKNTFKDDNVALVSAGPSLDDDIDALKKYSSNFYIVSCGRTVEALLNKEIIPDIIVVIDGGLPQYDVMKNVLKRPELKDTPLLYNISTYFKVIEDYIGPTIPFETQLHMHDIFGKFFRKKIYKINWGTPCVANAMLDISYMLGFSKVIFFGQDLSYPGKKLHSDNSAYEDNVLKKSDKRRRYTTTKDINDNEIITSEDLLMFKRNIEAFIQENSDREYYNVSRKGAYIKGMKHRGINDVITELGAAKKKNKSINGHIDSKSDKQVMDNLKEMLSELQMIYELVEDGLKLIDKLEVNMNKPRNLRKYNLELNKIEKDIIEETKKISLLTIILQPIFFWSKNQQIDPNHANYTEEIILKTKKFYMYMKIKTKKILNEIENKIH